MTPVAEIQERVTPKVNKKVFLLCLVIFISQIVNGQTGQLNIVNGVIDFSGAGHTPVLKIVANVAALPATGCKAGEVAMILSPQGIYQNSTNGSCTWAAASSGGTITGTMTPGTIPKAATSSSLTDSIMTESAGSVSFGGNASIGPFGNGIFAGNSVSLTSLGVEVFNTGIVSFATGGGVPGTLDTGYSRCSPGVSCFGTGAQGSFAGRIKATNEQTVAVATSTLPTCNSGNAGTRAAVNDATAPAIGVALTGGGSIFAMVHCSATTNSYIVDGL